MTTTIAHASAVSQPASVQCVAALLVTMALLGSYGAMAATSGNVVVTFLLALPWFGARWFLLWLGRRAGLVPLRTFVVLALAQGAAMLGVAIVQISHAVPGGVHGHAAFGEHAVRVTAGFPWPGVEGNGYGGAMERIPFLMGIDALLVNVTVFAVLFAFLLRRASVARLAELAPVAALFAGVGALCGGWSLIVLFD